MIKTGKIQLVEITPEMLQEAKERAKEIPSDLKNSILKGDGNLTSCVGQMAFEKLSGAEQSNTYHWDSKLKDKLCEVKSKLRTVPPKGDYDCSVTNANTKQKCDFYVFVSVLKDFTKAWVLGYRTPKEYFEDAIFLNKGDLDPSNGYICKATCWNLKVRDLKDIKELYE